jgi:hypothetical protein
MSDNFSASREVQARRDLFQVAELTLNWRLQINFLAN